MIRSVWVSLSGPQRGVSFLATVYFSLKLTNLSSLLRYQPALPNLKRACAFQVGTALSSPVTIELDQESEDFVLELQGALGGNHSLRRILSVLIGLADIKAAEQILSEEDPR